MTTAEAIEGITDAGDFEILATRVLRLTDEDCRLLEHMGVNAAGKTVPNPVDSFCIVPGVDPPRFVMAAFTTEKVESLERKWLFDHSAVPAATKTAADDVALAKPKKRTRGPHKGRSASEPKAKKATAADDGDLIKASRQALALRKDHPGATCVVYLCTNKQPDDELMAKVFKRGQELGLDVRFLTRSRLRDTLDVTPDGQWLRKEHLGIQAERLSFALLRELSAKSLQQYGREFLITPPEAFVTTSSERALAASLVPSCSLYMVTGTSGSGKSVSCYQVLHKHVTQGGVGLRIPGELAARATSLEEAIGLTLRALYPTIEPTAGAVALGLTSLSQRLLVIVDDINRSSSPPESLRKVLAWSRPSGEEKNIASSSPAVLVPAWDLFWAPLDKQFTSASWLARVPVNKMEEAEALACLAAALGSRVQRFAEADRRQIIVALAYDPILIALYADSVVPHGGLHPPALAHEVIDRFVQMAEAEATTSTGHLPAEYDRALQHLAAQMLDQRDLYPRWEDVQEWLAPGEVQAIRELARFGKVCRVTDRGGENRFEFRHDRILEHFLVRALQPMLADLESNADVLADPFYASFVGRAIVATQPSEELLEWLQQHAPLALISSLCLLPGPPNETADRIAAAAKLWLESASRNPRTPPVLLWEAYRLLEGADTPYLLDVTQCLPRDLLLARARLANGDAAAGAVALSSAWSFAPAVNDRDLDAVLRRGIHRHRQRLIRDCAAILGSQALTEAERCGALVLAGFISDSALAASVRTAWKLATDKPNILLAALWAGLRCAASDPPSVLDEMLAVWAELPDDHAGNSLSKRAYVAQELQFAVWRGIPRQVVEYLIARARADERLRWPITFMLQDLDQPFAVSFLIEEAAEIERRCKDTKGFSPWLMTLGDHWDVTKETRGRRLPADAVQAIRTCWESQTAEPQLRETAFKMWVRAVDDLDVLRSVPSDHPQIKDALWRRARLGDLSAIHLIRPVLAVDHHWFHVVAKIWTEQFRDLLNDALLDMKKSMPSDHTNGMTDDHFMLAQLLRDIPANEAQPLLIKHWGYLKFSPLFVQAALYIGSPQCVELAAAAIGDYPSNIDPLKFLGDFFGFFVTGLMDRVEHRHLEVLLPYLGRLDDSTLWYMAEFCERRGQRDWALQHLKPECDRRRAQLLQIGDSSKAYVERLGQHHFPSDADLRQELDRIERLGARHFANVYHWSEEFERRQDDHMRWQRILSEWFASNPTIERFRLFANAMSEHGTRKDIDLLYEHEISGDPDEIEQLRTSARIGIMRRSLQ